MGNGVLVIIIIKWFAKGYFSPFPSSFIPRDAMEREFSSGVLNFFNLCIIALSARGEAKIFFADESF